MKTLFYKCVVCVCAPLPYHTCKKVQPKPTRVVEISKQLWNFPPQIKQKVSFQHRQDIFCAKHDRIKCILLILGDRSDIYWFYICKLFILCWILCGNYWKFRGWVTETNKLFACLFLIISVIIWQQCTHVVDQPKILDHPVLFVLIPT